MRTKRVLIRDPICVLLAATGMILLGLVGPGLRALPPAGAVTAAPTAFVANNLSGTVSPIDTATDTVVDTITVGTRPTEIAITPDGTTAYVANFDFRHGDPDQHATNTAGTPSRWGPTSRYRHHP